MAETREVNVKVNVVPGDGADLQRQAQALATVQGGGVSQQAAILAQGQQQAAAQGVSGAQQQSRILQEAQQQIEARDHAAAVRKQMIALQAARGEATIPRGAVSVQPGMGAQALALAQQVPGIGGIASSLAGVAGGGMMGAAGMIGPVMAAGMGIGTVLHRVAESLRPYPVTLAEIHSRFQQALATLNSTRATGLTTAEQLIRGMGAAAPQRLRQIQAAQAAGNYPEQQRLLREEQAEATQQAEQLEAQNPDAARLELETGLRALREQRRAPGGGGQLTPDQLVQIGRINQINRQFTGNNLNIAGVTDASQLTDEQITQAGQSITGRAVQARSRASAAGAALGPGGIPSLRAGAPGLDQMPNFESRQGNFLDLHSQIQQEAVRDQRQQTQFQAQMNLAQEIIRELRRIGNPNAPAPVGPA